MSLAYNKMPLDRCTNQRKSLRWLKAEFNRDNTLFCVINDGMSLFNKTDELTVIYLNKEQLSPLSVESCIFLGKGSIGSEDKLNQPLNNNELLTANRAIFAIDFNKLRFSTQEEISSMGEWQVLRQATASLSGIDASILALAKGLIHWHATHQYCGQCGNINRSVEAGHAKKCTDCRNLSFPRTDPAVIMLVEKMFSDGIPRCLLGRQDSWPKGMYSTLAGFVDPGESLEQAVIREVLEESDITIENPKYIASQPWPFPASIMLGFTAVATSEKIDVTQDSLEDAQWFSREQLSQFVKNNTVINTEKNIDKREEITNEKPDNSQYIMSSSDSISSYLITAWLNKEIGEY